MRLDLSFDMDNAAFDDMPGRQAATILEGVAACLRIEQRHGTIYDANGNRIGAWGVKQ